MAKNCIIFAEIVILVQEEWTFRQNMFPKSLKSSKDKLLSMLQLKHFTAPSSMQNNDLTTLWIINYNYNFGAFWCITIFIHFNSHWATIAKDMLQQDLQ